MYRLKRNLWKPGITTASTLLLMVWVSLSAASAYEGVSALARPVTVTVQATPTEDATVTALNKEKLKGDVAQQQHTLRNWLWSNAAAILSGFLSTLVVAVGLLIGFRQWSVNRDDTRSKELKAQAEERFKTAVTALGDEKEGVQVGGAILLRSFLNKDDKKSYERYYIQVFDLAVAHLRLPRTSKPPKDQDTSLPLTTLRQALIVTFKEVFPLARNQQQERSLQYQQFLDATGIQLDNAFLAIADLTQIWMPQAYLRETTLSKATLTDANLTEATLSNATLSRANLSIADLSNATLTRATLTDANLTGANLTGANLSFADLSFATLRNANLTEATLSNATLSGATLRNANLTEATLSNANLSGANLSIADLSNANLTGANLTGANLSFADLSFATLSNANLRNANLTEATLSNANLRNANLTEATLSNATLRNANLTEATLSNATLSGAILSNTNVTEAQLNQAKSLEGTTMPDGTVHP